MTHGVNIIQGKGRTNRHLFIKSSHTSALGNPLKLEKAKFAVIKDGRVIFCYLILLKNGLRGISVF